SHFSMEQAEGVNAFLGHTEDEAQFFLLLLQFSRAGTPALRKRLEGQIQQIAKRRHFLKDRLGVKESINSEDQAKFYSTWLYGAVHVIVSIEKFQTKEAISKYLGISLKRSGEILEFLESLGLVVKNTNGKYSMGTARVHLASDSPMISKFHANWRMKSIQSLDNDDAADSLHYSSAITISAADQDRIKSMLVNTIDEVKKIVKDSKEEGIHSLCFDFYRL
ncbi:MAG: TIGR02147 family protein, partial [Bdellovibrionota bacterium]